MWTSVTTIEIAKYNLKWRGRCRESKLTLSVWSASGGQSSPFGMRGQPTIQYVLYCIVVYCVQYNARPTNEPQRVIMIHLVVLCTALALQWWRVVQHFYLATWTLTITVCSIMSMGLLSDLVILCNDAICWRLQFWEAYMLPECFQVAGCLIKPECRELL